ncbi:MAG: hypothetical protein CMF55_04715 [Legionellales bacterium]|nr:hypothetical protein [Legionellales bacterium]HAG61275.1 hypothetical protein [Coxiellaceae bacterium]
MKHQAAPKSSFAFLSIAFLNTFVDIGHKALMMDTVYATSTAHQYTLLSSIVNALMILPYLFLFTFSGFIADRWPKILILRITSFSTIPLTIFLTLCYFQGWFWPAFSTTVLMALQSVLNSPAKYGYIREAFGVSNIARLNAMVQAAVIIAIVVSQAVFTFSANALVAHRLAEVTTRAKFITGFAPIGFVLVALSVFEFTMTFRLLRLPAADPQSKYRLSSYVTGQYLRSYLRTAFHKRVIFICMIGLSLFFAINQELLAIYGGYLKESVGSSADFALSSIGVAGIGILIGAMFAGRISRGFIEVATIPLATLAMCLGLIFLSQLRSEPWIVVMMLLYGTFAGMLIVPLNALIQFHAKPASLGKVLATNNFLQMLSMFAYLLFGIVLIHYFFSIAFQLNLLIVLGFVGLLASLYYFPQSFIRYERFYLTRSMTDLRVEGLSALSHEGGVLLDHQSDRVVDWSLLQMASPRFLHSVIWPGQEMTKSYHYYSKRLNKAPIIVTSIDQAVEQINLALQAGDMICAIPEQAEHRQMWSAIVSRLASSSQVHYKTVAVECDFQKRTRLSQRYCVRWQAVS